MEKVTYNSGKDLPIPSFVHLSGILLSGEHSGLAPQLLYPICLALYLDRGVFLLYEKLRSENRVLGGSRSSYCNTFKGDNSSKSASIFKQLQSRQSKNLYATCNILCTYSLV